MKDLSSLMRIDFQYYAKDMVAIFDINKVDEDDVWDYIENVYPDEIDEDILVCTERQWHNIFE